MHLFEHKGYSALPRLEIDDGLIAGKLLGIDALILFEGETVESARKAFVEAVDDYLAWCEEDGIAPERPFSGRLTILIPPDLHRTLSLAAEAAGVTIGDVIADRLGGAARGAGERSGQVARSEVGRAIDPDSGAPSEMRARRRKSS